MTGDSSVPCKYARLALRASTTRRPPEERGKARVYLQMPTRCYRDIISDWHLTGMRTMGKHPDPTLTFLVYRKTRLAEPARTVGLRTGALREAWYARAVPRLRSSYHLLLPPMREVTVPIRIPIGYRKRCQVYPIGNKKYCQVFLMGDKKR
ncbi:hypothetical protein BDV96DRAFT_93305 [Lophiotrema nucula]|uniref:Uncharacterized protein n=1 Tax=Lophiotrema nucula TaxID=690887 RepID=A0A6A5Z7S7_9PLEO|nr:hypothetical protein BDV96DRAFT_93305 [Lophiotrema nucula]